MVQPTPFLRRLAAGVCASSWLALAACGGNGTEDTSQTAEAPAASKLESCFDVRPGTAYTMSDGDRVLIGQEAFEGGTRNARISLLGATGTRRSFADYWSRESSGIRFWGNQAYQDDAGNAVSSKTVSSSGQTLPTSLQPGQSVVLSYVDTTTEDGQTTNRNFQETWTFTGLVTQTLGGKQFIDMCRIDIGDADGSATQWWAKGFGVIRYEIKDLKGTVLESGQLDAITAQP